MSVNNKGIVIYNYLHPVKPVLSSTEIKLLIKLQSPVILPSNDIDNLCIDIDIDIDIDNLCILQTQLDRPHAKHF